MTGCKMDNSFARALLKAFEPDLKTRFQPRVAPLDIKLHVERIRLAELIRAASAAQADTNSRIEIASSAA